MASRELFGLLMTFSPVNNVDVTVFLISLKAGGVALNLTEASHVYLMDSWWVSRRSSYGSYPSHL